MWLLCRPPNPLGGASGFGMSVSDAGRMTIPQIMNLLRPLEKHTQRPQTVGIRRQYRREKESANTDAFREAYEKSLGGK